jgi:hypothetical protein
VYGHLRTLHGQDMYGHVLVHQMYTKKFVFLLSKCVFKYKNQLDYFTKAINSTKVNK